MQALSKCSTRFESISTPSAWDSAVVRQSSNFNGYRSLGATQLLCACRRAITFLAARVLGVVPWALGRMSVVLTAPQPKCPAAGRESPNTTIGVSFHQPSTTCMSCASLPYHPTTRSDLTCLTVVGKGASFWPRSPHPTMSFAG